MLSGGRKGNLYKAFSAPKADTKLMKLPRQAEREREREREKGVERERYGERGVVRREEERQLREALSYFIVSGNGSNYRGILMAAIHYKALLHAVFLSLSLYPQQQQQQQLFPRGVGARNAENRDLETAGSAETPPFTSNSFRGRGFR